MAEQIIKNNEIFEKISYTANLLSRYYYHEIGLRKAKIYQLVNDFLKQNSEEYKESEWYISLDRYAQRAKKYPLVKIDYIEITQYELERLQTANLNEQKILFSCVCIAKYYNALHPANNNWVNLDCKDIFSLANIKTTRKKQFSLLKHLKDQGFISLSKKIDNTNFKVSFIQSTTATDSDVVLKITNINDLGYQYEKFIGNHDIYQCKCCGKYLKAVKNNNYALKTPMQTRKKKYCDECREEKLRARYIKYHKNKASVEKSHN